MAARKKATVKQEVVEVETKTPAVKKPTIKALQTEIDGLKLTVHQQEEWIDELQYNRQVLEEELAKVNSRGFFARLFNKQ